MEEDKVVDQPEVKPKPKLHIWNQILEDDELSEKLAASMTKLGDEFTRRFIRKKKNRKNKKKKKNKKDPNTTNNTNGNVKTNGTPIHQIAKPEVNLNQNVVQSQPQKSQQSNNNRINQPTGGFSQKSKRKSKLPDNVLQSEAKNICKRLKEKRIDLIIRTIRHLGLDEAMKLCSEVLTIEEAGGLMTLNGVRRRTSGGIFFHLIRSSGRYEASIVSKIFKEGEGKEPVFKKRIKSKPNSAPGSKNSTGDNVTNETSSITNCPSTATVVEMLQPISPSPSTSTITPITPTTIPLTQSDQPIIEPEQSTQSINSVNPIPGNDENGGNHHDVRMDEDEDDYETSNLVIVEYDPTNLDTDNPDSEQLIKCTFPVNKKPADLNILSYQQPSPLPLPPPQPTTTTTVISEISSTINSNVPMFTTNHISVDA